MYCVKFSEVDCSVTEARNCSLVPCMLNMAVSLDVKLCSLVGCFGGIYWLHHQGSRIYCLLNLQAKDSIHFCITSHFSEGKPAGG
jgi:hypothetical protein